MKHALWEKNPSEYLLKNLRPGNIVRYENDDFLITNQHQTPCLNLKTGRSFCSVIFPDCIQIVWADIQDYIKDMALQ